MISSVRRDGSTACMVVEGATDCDVFSEYVRQVLVPTLRAGDCVVMDNLAPHKTPCIHRLIEATGATIRWLPPYSPDLNPIEKMWSKVKESLRAAKARTSESLQSAIAHALQSITPDDAAHWFASCGYTIT
jgi:transposase